MEAKQRYEVLDGMRGIAAFIVMLFHYNIQHGYRIFYNAFTAVDFFFILSGFVLLHSYGNRLNTGMTARDFISRRIARLLPLTALGVIVGVPALLVMQHFSQTDFTVFGIFGAAARNMFFIPAVNTNWFIADGATISGQLFPTDGPLWSIFFEFAAGFGFIHLARLGYGKLSRWCVVSFGLIVLYSIWNGHIVGNRTFDFDAGWSGSNFIGGFPRVIFGFTCGMLIYRMTTTYPVTGFFKKMLSWPVWHPTAVYAALICALTFPLYVKGIYSLVEVGIIAPILVFQGSRSICKSAGTSMFSARLGQLSFPVYCLHYPVMSALKALAITSGVLLPSPTILVTIAVSLTLLLSHVVSSLFEHFQIQRRLTSHLNNYFTYLAVRTT